MTIWLFIGRLNPPHIWHIAIIDKMLLENDKAILMIWTNWENDKNNPLKFNQIKKILGKKYGGNRKLKVVELKDDSSDLVWIQDIEDLLYKYWEWIKKINFYWWDFETDSAYRVIKKYEDELWKYNITYIEISRKNSFIEYKWEKYNISATNLRKALIEWNFDLAEKFCDKEMFEGIKEYFLRSISNHELYQKIWANLKKIIINYKNSRFKKF
jgi:nicotinamide mononucleotide adenylyltransferase